MEIFIAIYLVGFAAVCCALGVEFKRTLMMMQQNSYRTDRYMRWLRSSGDTTSMMRLLGLCVFLLSLATFSISLWAMSVMLVWGICVYAGLSRRKYKKPLVWTNRVKRIFAVQICVSLIVVAAVALLCDYDWVMRLFCVSVAAVGLYCASHIVTMLSVVLLSPVEKRINRGYINDAKRRLASMPSLRIIGITGSYGKTSTKHYLHRILSESFQTTMTPGSYNTTLGVVRTVREYLKPYDEVFIVEMGAKQPGDIREICDIVHPSIGIVTAVGEQHLESFKSIENVQRTKFELVDSLPSDGLAVVNDDFEMIRSREVSNTECVRYAVSSGSPAAEWRAENIEYSRGGTSFTVVGPNVRLELQTKLVGECNISNLLGCVAVALRLGVPNDKIKYAVSRIEQVEHRLSVKQTAGGVTIIDDAFNSNPAGSAMALDVLSRMKGGKRIVITPGMIELGDKTVELNRAFGRKIAASADFAIVVGEYNRDAIVSGIKEGEMAEDNFVVATDFNHAQQILGDILRAGDIVLYENDLPDTFK